MTSLLDVTGIGNAIVDVIGESTDAFLDENALTKGAMMLVDAERAEALYRKMQASQEKGLRETSGGSAGNTLAGLASLGGRGAYIGKVKNDALGEIFSRDMRKLGTRFETPPAVHGASTARCLIFVTPDAQRTMNTYLGACVDLGPEDIDPRLIGGSQVTYLEGYLFDPPQAKRAFVKAATIAHEAGRQVALSLSDSFCVARHRTEFQDLVHDHVDILFANEAEILSLYESDDFADAARLAQGHCGTIALTRSAKGSVILSGGRSYEVPAKPVANVVDTTGAGDLYAAGFLYGHTRGMSPSQCGDIGAFAAAEVISHFGARPECSLAALLRTSA